MAPAIKTRILILSDTHGRQPVPPGHNVFPRAVPSSGEHGWVAELPLGYREPLPAADVALHCGDITKYSSLAEYEATIETMMAISAPLKLIIAGNHDMALDKDFVADCWPDLGGRATPCTVLDMFLSAESEGVRYLEEGTHSFTLANGARLTVYASPFTPNYGGWALQYEQGTHDFAIPHGVDIAMTHGPPRGVLDLARNRQHAGCPSLFQSVYSARPKIHCFGHIHEAWGCCLAEWREYHYTAALTTAAAGGEPPLPTCENSIDAAKSRVSTLADLKHICLPHSGVPFDYDPDTLGQLVDYQSVRVDLTACNPRLEPGRQTLFVNAAICSVAYRPEQRPFLVDVYLDKDEGQPCNQEEPTGEALASELLASAAAGVGDDDYSTNSTLQ